ncbi:MAG: hypothetical protein K2P39_15290 [Lachnospiraceae bacterium]|nr:hypothetical protein [Lachnospiraceae bacterium]
MFKAGILAAGLSAFWLFPFMEQHFTHSLSDMGGLVVNNIVSLSDWFISYYYVKDRSVWFPSTFGIPLAVWTILYAAHGRFHKNKRMLLLLSLSWILCIFMTSHTAMKAAEAFLGFMQFSWRLLSIVALLLSIVIVFVFYGSRRKWGVFSAIYIVYAACFLLSDSAWFHLELVSDIDVAYSCNNADALYIPQGGALSTYDVRGELVDTNLPELQFEWERLPKAQLRLKYSNNTGYAVVQLPLYFYKGYEAYDLVNHSRLFVEKGDAGLIWVHLDPYEAGEVVVSYTGTSVQKVSDWISIFTWILLFILMRRRHSGFGSG